MVSSRDKQSKLNVFSLTMIMGNITAHSFTNYAPGCSPVWQIDAAAPHSIIVPTSASCILAISHALEQGPVIIHHIYDNAIMVPQQTHTILDIALALHDKSMINQVFLQRILTGMSDNIMQEQLEKARSTLRKLGIIPRDNLSFG